MGTRLGGTPPYTATLDTGDGTGPQPVGAGNPADIGDSETYTTAGIKTFTLTVTDSAAASVSRSGTIRVFGAPTKDQLVNMAISNGKRYLYLNQLPAGVGECMWRGQSFQGAGARNDYSTASTGAALLAFEENGHRPGNDPVADIYAQTVQKGLDWLTATANDFAIGLQTAGDPDSNGNGVGSYLITGGGETYANGFAALALVAAEQTAAGAAARTVASGPLAGKSYLDLVTDIIDLFSYSQTDAGTQGGWRYALRTSNSAVNDASAMQWPSLLFLAASDAWGVSTPAWVLDRTADGFKGLQAANGGVGYTSNSSWRNGAKTGGALVGWTAAGLNTSDPDVQAGVDFIGNTYNTQPNGSNDQSGVFGQWYGMYGVKKGLQLQGVTTANTPNGPRDWQSDMDCWLLGDASGLDPATSPGLRSANSLFGQQPAGNWIANNIFPQSSANADEMATANGILILTRSITVALPVAVIAECGEVSVKPGVQSFQMDGTGSFHSDPTLSIAEYRWDFDASDGVDFDNPDATGAIVTNPGYTVVGNYTVTLQVRDNSDPQRVGQSSEVCVAVDTDVAPVSIAKPPGVPSYNCQVGETITLDGTSSFDPDGDPIDSYEWDLDGDGQFDDATGATPDFECLVEGQVSVRLRVTAGGKSDVSFEVVLVTSPKDISVNSLTCTDINVGVSADLTVEIGENSTPSQAFTNVLVRFYDGNPFLGGPQLGGNFNVDVPAGGTVSLTADDLPLGSEDEVFVRIDANDQIPEFNEENNLASVNCSNSPPVAVAKNLTVSADENCEGQAAAADFDDGSSDPDGDALTFSVDPSGPYPLGTTDVVLTVTDPAGASDTAPASITVVDDSPPVIDPAAQDLTVECDGAGNEGDLDAWLASNGGASATDNCGDVTWSNDFSGLVPGDCPGEGSATVTFTATDEFGNASSTTATYSNVDTTPPVISFCLVVKGGGANAVLEPIPDITEFDIFSPKGRIKIRVKADDLCSENVDLSVVILADQRHKKGNVRVKGGNEIRIAEVDHDAQILLRVDATDDCGNTAEIRHVFVEGGIQPAPADNRGSDEE